MHNIERMNIVLKESVNLNLCDECTLHSLIDLCTHSVDFIADLTDSLVLHFVLRRTLGAARIAICEKLPLDGAAQWWAGFTAAHGR